MKIVSKGAEGILYLDEKSKTILKKRIKKEYRIKELDDRLNKRRTRSEAKILRKARDRIKNVPKITKVDEKNYSIEMEYLKGGSLKKIMGKFKKTEIKSFGKIIGLMIAKLHSVDIIHNDLTTSNMMLVNGRIFFIDFGLSFFSTRTEDKGMDLVVLKKSLNATHPKKFNIIFNSVINGYKKEASQKNFREIGKRIATIESRVRYK